jgi:hypothetical protein
MVTHASDENTLINQQMHYKEIALIFNLFNIQIYNG